MPGFLVGSWAIRSANARQGKLEAILSVARMIEIAVPGLGPQYSLVQKESMDANAPLGAGEEPVLTSVPVHDDGWPEPVRWVIACRESPSHLLGSLADLAARYRITVILNLSVMGLAILLGMVGFGQVRRAMSLEAEKKQQERMQELERQVLHNERLASVGQLAAGMAHEINNPLEGMANYLSLLEEDLRAGRHGDTVNLVCRIREGLDRVAGVIRQVLTFADPGLSALVPLDLNSVLNDTVLFVRSNPAFRQTHVMVNVSREDLSILGNRVTLGQLFLNLLMNACQVQPEGGQIEVASIKEGNRAIIIVADCGPGIPDHVLPKIFEPFYSTRGSTGLGLSVCHGIVEEHGGRIVAHNRLGGGAIFQVEFPLYTGAEAREAVESL
jgi:signal transduction histidine kinase